MLGDTSSNLLSGFQFTTIGKPPSLLGRITSRTDDSQDPVASPSSSPLSSPKMTVPHGTPTSWFVNAPTTHQGGTASDETPQTGQSAARMSDASSSMMSHHSLPARPSPTVVGKAEQHKSSKAPIPGARTSHSSSSLPTHYSSGSALRPTSSATSDRSPVLPPPPPPPSLARASHTDSMSPPFIDKSLPEDEADMANPLRQAVARFEAGVEEIRHIQAEAVRAMASFQDKGAHVHAHGEGLLEQFRSKYANDERRVARANHRVDELEKQLHEARNTIAQRENDLHEARNTVAQRERELREARNAITRLEREKKDLRGELDRVHGELDQLRGELERVRIQAGKDEARLNEALKTCQEAIRETELARARWAVVQKKLEDQLAAQKRDANADKEALLAQLEELKRAAEDFKRLVAVLVEEKRKLEVQVQADVAQRKQSDESQKPGYHQPGLPAETVKTVEGNEQTHNSPRKPTDLPASKLLPVFSSISSPPSTVSTISHPPVSHRPPSAHLTTSGDRATQQRSRGKLLHLADESPPCLSTPPPNEPSPAVKDEDQDEVKAKAEPVDETFIGPSFTSQSHPSVREQRREQSLDYAPIPQEPPQSPSMYQPGPEVTTLSSSVVPHTEEHGLGHPAVSFGRDTPELAYPSRQSSYDPTLPPRELSPAPFAHTSSGRAPALEFPQPQSSTNLQPTGERRGPVTPPLENAPSAQPKRFVKRRGPPQTPPPDQAMDSAAVPALPIQPPVQRSPSPSTRRGSDSWRPPREHESRPPVRYSDENRDRHKRKRDDDADTRQPVLRRPRLTPPRGPHLYPPAHDHYSPPASQQTPQDFTRFGARTPPRQLSDDRSPYQQPLPQEHQHHNAPPSDAERAYIPAPNGNLRRRVDHYSPPPQQRTQNSTDAPMTGWRRRWPSDYRATPMRQYTISPPPLPQASLCPGRPPPERMAVRPLLEDRLSDDRRLTSASRRQRRPRSQIQTDQCRC
ncbi:hypothetical protein LXA43DRAFT_997459 [Ganoderma leucocontextum]|nr:hypothetical protein LXA43DRAFT_997459 [Ganoderma leucocontextum]